jgi:hypothetical protein
MDFPLRTHPIFLFLMGGGGGWGENKIRWIWDFFLSEWSKLNNLRGLLLLAKTTLKGGSNSHYKEDSALRWIFLRRRNI